MFSIAEQFSTATKSQLESQLKIINSLASTAVSSAEQGIALNLSTTKASVEKSSSAAKQLLQAKDPQEFIKLSTSQPSSFDSLLAYGNQLFSIATKAQAELIRAASAQAKEAPAAPALKLAPPKAAAPVVVKETAAPANEPEAAPVEAAPKAAKPAAKAKPVETAAEPVAEVVEPVEEPSKPVVLKSVQPAKAKIEAKADKK